MAANATFGRRAPGGANASVQAGLRSKARPLSTEDVTDSSVSIEPDAAKARSAPVLTCGVIALLMVIFAAERRFSIGPVPGATPGHDGLIALGAASGRLVFGAHEPWRLVTATLLHANLSHIVGNLVVLFLAGATLERLIGRAWLGAVFVVSALGGSLASVAMNPASTTTVGASGAIMGLLATAFVCSFHFQAYDQSKRIRIVCLRLLIPALIPFSNAQGATIDYNAHGGGTLAGVVMGFIIQILWAEDQRRPAGVPVAAGIGAGGVILAALSFLMVAKHYPAYAAAGERYAPPWAMPRVTKTALADPAFGQRTAELVGRYPRDPRSHMFRSLYLSNASDFVGAEAEVRTALDERDALTNDMPAKLEPTLHLELAAILAEEHRLAEAQSEAQPYCTPPQSDQNLESMRQALIKGGICAQGEALSQ